jgi:hypothetical protein
MNSDDHALVACPIDNDISAGRVILREPHQAVENPHIEAFVDHCQRFFASWAQQS